jgi:hypothetical protein
MKSIPLLSLFALLLTAGCQTPNPVTPRQADGTYLCTDCDLKYADQAMAQKCYDWCTTQHSCNAEITQHAVGSLSTP